MLSAFLNKGLKALVHYLSSSRSLLGFLSYVNSIAATARNSLKKRLQGVGLRRPTPCAPERSRFDKMHPGAAGRGLAQRIFCNLPGQDCRSGAPAVWSSNCPE
jgi:hypothetical protein